MKKVEITTADLVYLSGYMRAFKQATLSGKIGYSFSKLLRKLTKEIKIWEEEGRQPLLDKYAIPMTEEVAAENNRMRSPNSQPVEAGMMYIPPGSKTALKYEEEIKPKLEVPLTLEFMEMPLTDFINALGRWPENFWYDALWFLWDDEDLPDNFTPDFEKNKDKNKDD